MEGAEGWRMKDGGGRRRVEEEDDIYLLRIFLLQFLRKPDLKGESKIKNIITRALKQVKGRVKKNLTDQILFSLYLEPRYLDL
jgi:hypothetical protein